MKRWIAVTGLVAALAFAAAGCSNGPEEDGGGAPKAGGVVLKKYPKAGDWDVAGTPMMYKSGDTGLDMYAEDKIIAQVRANLLDTLLSNQYGHCDRDKAVDAKGRPKPDVRRVRVELWIFQAPYGAAKTFQEWRRGQSINDVGEAAFAESDAVIFLRGAVVVRLVPLRWPPKTAGDATIQIGKAIDAWLQGK